MKNYRYRRYIVVVVVVVMTNCGHQMSDRILELNQEVLQ